MSFVGLRIAGTVAVLSILGAIGVTVLWYSTEHAERSTRAELEEDVSARAEAGRLALVAILEADAESEKRDAALFEAKKNAASARAKELVALAQSTADLSAIPLAPGEQLQLAASAIEEPNRALAVGPVLVDSQRVVARVSYDAAPQKNAALGRALGAIVNLGETPEPVNPLASQLPILVLATMFTALLAMFFAYLRLGRPIAETLERARALAHGDTAKRADETRGSRDAREIARAMNALVDRAERLKVQGRAARDEDLSALVRAVEDLARGELGGEMPRVGEPLEPLARAIHRASADLVERIRTLRQLSLELATRAAEIAPSAKKIGAASLEQAEALAGIGTSAGEAAVEVKNARDRLGSAIAELHKAGAEERKVAKELRLALLAAGRRLDVSRLPNDLAALREEVRESAAALESIGASLPEPPAGINTALTGNLHDAASGLLRISEQTARAMKSLERSARGSAEGAEQMRRAVVESAELAPRLASVIASFAIGTSFETDMLERLDRWQKEAKLAAASPDGLTEEGRAAVRQVIETSENARARLSRLVSATESAIDVLRG
jgi:methyl-accepting chemotaxis protein